MFPVERLYHLNRINSNNPHNIKHEPVCAFSVDFTASLRRPDAFRGTRHITHTVVVQRRRDKCVIMVAGDKCVVMVTGDGCVHACAGARGLGHDLELV